MLQNLYPEKLFLVIDVLDILEEYHLNPVVASLFPNITPQHLIVIATALPASPNWRDQMSVAFSKTFKNVICQPEVIVALEIMVDEISSVIDRKIIAATSYDPSSEPPFFWKWLNFHTLVLVNQDDVRLNQQLQQESFKRMLCYISEPNHY